MWVMMRRSSSHFRVLLQKVSVSRAPGTFKPRVRECAEHYPSHLRLLRVRKMIGESDLEAAETDTDEDGLLSRPHCVQNKRRDMRPIFIEVTLHTTRSFLQVVSN